MAFTPDQIAMLQAPLDPRHVKPPHLAARCLLALDHQHLLALRGKAQGGGEATHSGPDDDDAIACHVVPLASRGFPVAELRLLCQCSLTVASDVSF